MCQCTTETWTTVPGFEGSYEVSTCGRVRSLDRTVTYRNRWGTTSTHHLRGRILRPATKPPGYQSVAPSHDATQHSVRVHDLVLTAFVGPPPVGHEACHWDRDPGNNHLSNLRWDTRSSNIYDQVRHGTHYQSRKVTCPLKHKLIEPNLRPDTARNGYRGCLACHQSQKKASYARKHGRLHNFRSDADHRYEMIIRGVRK